MKHEQLTYPDALRWLANRYNIEIQERQLTDEQKKEQSEREAMFIVNEWAADYFKEILENDIDGRAIVMQYFRQPNKGHICNVSVWASVLTTVMPWQMLP